MPATGESHFNKEKIMRFMSSAAHKSMVAIALQIEARAKVNIVANDQVDTGFMLNSVFTVSPEMSGYEAARSAAFAKNLDGEMGPPPDLGNFDAAVGVGAAYAIYQELRASFLAKAVIEVSKEAPGIVQGTFKDEMHD